MAVAKQMSVEDLDNFIIKKCNRYLRTALVTMPSPRVCMEAKKQFQFRVMRNLKGESKMLGSVEDVQVLATSHGWRTAGVLALCNNFREKDLCKAFPHYPYQICCKVMLYSEQHDDTSLVLAWIAGGGRRKHICDRAPVQNCGTLSSRRKRKAEKASKIRNKNKKDVKRRLDFKTASKTRNSFKTSL